MHILSHEWVYMLSRTLTVTHRMHKQACTPKGQLPCPPSLHGLPRRQCGSARVGFSSRSSLERQLGGYRSFSHRDPVPTSLSRAQLRVKATWVSVKTNIQEPRNLGCTNQVTPSRVSQLSFSTWAGSTSSPLLLPPSFLLICYNKKM